MKCLPRGTVSRVWDCFFIHGTVFLFRTALAIVDLLTPYLLEKSFESTVQVLLLAESAKGVWALIHDGAYPFPLPIRPVCLERARSYRCLANCWGVLTWHFTAVGMMMPLCVQKARCSLQLTASPFLTTCSPSWVRRWTGV